MSVIVDEHNRREFPFPRMDSLRTASSSGSSGLQSRSDSLQSKSLRSASSSGSPHSLPHTRLERDHHEGVLHGVPSKLRSRLMPRDRHDSTSLRTALAITTERLESETRRADDAERRVLEVLRKLRAAHEATMLAQAEASRAKEELTLFKYRFEDAQREILRAQELVDELEQAKLEAESEAARARSTARRYREQQLIVRAREEGRMEGIQEGLSRGRSMGFEEGVVADDSRERRYVPPTVEDLPEEEEELPESQYRSQTPGPAEIRVRTPAPEFRSLTPGPSIMSSGRVTPPPRRPPSRFSTSRASQRPHVSDTAHFAPTLPVPTIVTPLNDPSPSHSRAGTPAGMPVPHPAPRSLDDNEGEIFTPIPIHEPQPSPMHPPVEIPPDGYIPYAGSSEEIYLPPPHELSRPITPASPTPPPAPAIHPVQPPQPSTSMAPPREPHVRSRDYAFAAGIPPEGVPVIRSNASGRPMSPMSKASTTISQFDLVGAPSSKGKLRLAMSGRSARDDVGSPRGPRPREVLPGPARPPPGERQDSRDSERSVQGTSPTSPLDRLFKKRFRSKSVKGTPPGTAPVIPDIIVESPSTPSTNRSSIKTTITQPHLLSPEHTVQPLAQPEDNIIVMRTEIPGYHPSIDQYLASGPTAPMFPLQSNDLPPGFIPMSMTPPMSASPLPDKPTMVPYDMPLPVPHSQTPVPVPPPGTPIPIPQRTTVPIRAPSNPRSIPSREAVPVPYDNPLPIPQREALPVPQRGSGSSSPRPARYDEAPVPAGVVYPEPPSRRQTPGPDRIGSPSSSMRRSRHRLDVRSPGASLSPLPLRFFAPLRSDAGTSES
ncbi:hypothetical protein OH76DRAFT_489641 [Lentinus brumalis]|uniref:Uncharacterized protein n=1 Tax=Lentinus brumalis TaxID=2498619 RepID=A0A371CI55_9APHY|nr:hypothetical protein OH76DRAFT_489641 [Polyporus brumalis]